MERDHREPDEDSFTGEDSFTEHDFFTDQDFSSDESPVRRTRQSRTGTSPWVAGAVATLAAGIGAVVAVSLASPAGTRTDASTTPGASASSWSSADSSSSGALPALPGNGNGAMTDMLIGKVLAVSATSITLGGNGPSVTGTITGSTKVSGKTARVAGIKVGDEVTAQLTGTGSTLTVTTIQDPA
jgi:hypothetical protein